jgi:nicotinic acid mononucleotide adenylyltransferase
MTPVDAAATEVRHLLAASDAAGAQRLAALVPPAVLAYIRTHHLYSEPHGH